MEHTGQSPEERPAKQRDVKDKPPPEAVLRRQGDRPGAGANTPSGPFPRDNTAEAKREREKQEAMKVEEQRDQEKIE